ncbi:MAG: hypothetical protein F4181_15555, partial [Proteobacteria bacterium]|nr:hypothetical protein [Pseudomonadota bacterium]
NSNAPPSAYTGCADLGTSVTMTVSPPANTAPVADAGEDQIARPSATVTLNGSGSSDADGDSLTYAWSQTSGTAVTLSSATVASPTFTAPSTAGSLVFSLKVNDGTEDSDLETVTVEVNSKPAADAGDDQIVRPSATETLDGSGSSDGDGDSMTYAWIQTPAATVTLSSATAVSPTFTAPSAAGSLEFSLTVNDGTEDSDPDTVTVTVNTKPVADAGANQTVTPGASVMLDGSGSSDADGHALTYTWSKRPGTTVDLIDSSMATASLTAPQLAAGQTSLTLEYQLVVNDKIEDSDPSIVTITVSNAAVPTADAGDDQTGDSAVNEGDTVTLDGSGSSDPNSKTLTYAWSGPSEVSVEFSDPAVASPTFIAPNFVSSRDLVLTLVVTNSDMVASAPDTVTVHVVADDDPPVAEAGENQMVRTDQMVTLDGTGSSDPENLPLQYTWSQASGSTVTLSSTTASSPTFTAPSTVGVLTFTLSVSDGQNTAVTDTVTVNVTNAPPPPGSITGPERTTDGSFTLTWTASDTTESVLYKLEESINGAAWTTVAGTGGMTSRAISGLTTPGPHSYRVSACLADETTTCSEPNDIHTVLYMPPGALVAIPQTSRTGDYAVSWTPLANTPSYRLQESTDGGETWHHAAGVTGNGYHFTDRPAGEYRYRLAACYAAPAGNAGYCRETGWDPISVTVKYDTEDSLETNTIAGTLPYDTGVTKGGDAYINIPIEPAPGVNGLEPMLSIDYGGGRERTRLDASLPGDTLGYGWRVSGFSTIRRCIKNQPAGRTLTIADTASLCLDGEPLVLTSGTHMRYGARYRSLRDSFARIEIKGPTDSDRRNELWFEVRLPDGSVREYGRSGDSRLKHIRYVRVNGGDSDAERELFGSNDYYEERATAHYMWSISKHTDAFGNTMEYSYLEDERNAVRHPARVMYGTVNGVTGAHDAAIAFHYVPRSDIDAVYMGPVTEGVAQTQDLRLYAVQVVLDSKPVRTYRFKSLTTDAGWQRLDKIQLCGYDTSGLMPECLKPIAVGWEEPVGTVPYTVTGVTSFTDPLGRTTQFEYDSLTKSGTHAFLFSERPFGTPTKPADVADLAPAPLGAGETAPSDGGAVKTVVTRVRRSNGRNGWHDTNYAYHGRGFASTRHWGYLGFYATRETDVESGVVTYTQYRLDYPYFGEIAAVHQYQGTYTSSARILSKRVMDHVQKTLTHSGGARTVLPYVERSTDWLYEGATTLGVTQRQTTLALSGNLLGSATETVTTGHSVTASGAGTVWGDAPTYTVGGVQRKTVSTVSLENLITANRWLIGFANRVQVAHHKGASATAERTQTATFTRHGQTNRVNTVTRFPGDTQHRLTTDYGYTATGLLNSVNVFGANVASRTTSATSFSNGRYPASVTNALGHIEGFAHDARFGLPTRYTDANGRITRVSYDAFGREKTRTTPDGVVIKTAYGTCPSRQVTCPSVSGVSPAMWVSTDSQVSPKSVEYLDKLGRLIHTAVEAFSGSGAYRQHFVYDRRGRVRWVSEPYTSTGFNASAPYTTYTYDVRDRVIRVAQPDGGSTAIGYTGQTNHRVNVTVTETLSNTATGTPATQITRRIYNVLGELVRSVDGLGATGAAAVTDKAHTTYTYDGSGLPDKISVWNTASPGTSPSRTDTVTTDFDHDVAGNRSRVVHPNFGTVTFAYTALGELRQRTEGTYTTTYGYDLLGRLKKRDDPGGVAQWTYDPANGKGALGTRCYNHSSTVAECGTTPGFKETLAYNTQSRLSSSTTALKVGTTSKTYAHSHTYDTHGRLRTTTYPTGLTARSDYNARGYLESLTDTASNSMLERYRAMNAYGQVTRETYANGVSTVRAFDPNSGRLTGIDTTAGTTVLQDTDYAWQSNGILKSRISHRGGMNAKTETFAYDALDRLRSAVTDLTGNAGARTLSMTYDRLGNLKTKTSSVSGDTGASGYTYGNGGSGQPPLTALTGVTVGGASHTLTHDVWGRVTQYDRSGTTTQDRYIGWNARHLPTTVTVGDSLTDATPKAKDEFLYGPDGQRYYKKSTWEVKGASDADNTYPVEHAYYAGTHREVVRVGDTVNASIATSAVSATVLHVRTTPVAGMPTAAFEYLHRDHLGSVESVTDASGMELKIQAYDPFGSRRASDWTRAMTDTERTTLAGEAPQRTARGYTGHEHLERTGLIHMNGRVYDPAIGRFLSPDPIVADASFSQGWNAYSYALNSPLSYSDPSGLTLVGGCPPSLCSGGGFGGGRGGFGPGSVPATSWHATINVGVIWSYGFGFGLPSLSRPSRMIYVQDPGADGGARGGGGLENRFAFGFPTLTPRLFVTVSYQWARAWVGIGEEQSPADLPMDVLSAAALDIGQVVIGVVGLIPGFGEPADAINAGISVARGNYQEAILDGASAVPATGHATGAVMVGVRVDRAVSGVLESARRMVKGSDVSPRTPIGHRGKPLRVPPGTNKPTTIEGRNYTGHALDRMQERGLTPSLIEDTITTGTVSSGRGGTSVFATHQMRVILDSSGRVITANPL